MSLSQVESKGTVRIDLSGRDQGVLTVRPEPRTQRLGQLGQVYSLRTGQPVVVAEVSVAVNPKQPA